MGLPTKDEMQGKVDQVKGNIKEHVGRTLNDKELEAEGDIDQVKGHIQEEYGAAKRNVGDSLKDLGDKARK
jgi:uncharacterized protein YjbJ (UPF0337 family)